MNCYVKLHSLTHSLTIEEEWRHITLAMKWKGTVSSLCKDNMLKVSIWTFPSQCVICNAAHTEGVTSLPSRVCWWLKKGWVAFDILSTNNNNTNTNDNVYGAVIMTQSLREFTRFIWRTQTSARWPPTLRPGQPTWAASPPVGCYMAYIRHRHLSITQLESWYSFYRPTEGGRLSQPRHTACSPI